MAGQGSHGAAVHRGPQQRRVVAGHEADVVEHAGAEGTVYVFHCERQLPEPSELFQDVIYRTS